MKLIRAGPKNAVATDAQEALIRLVTNSIEMLRTRGASAVARVVVLLYCCCAAIAASDVPAPLNVSNAFLNLRSRALDYAGPDRPADGSEIRLAWFMPAQTTNHLWWAAKLAVSDHLRDHPDSPPVNFLPCWSADPWSGGAANLAKTIYAETPLAIIGGPDSASTHLAEQIAAKANLPLISPVATDPSITVAGVPWMFSCAPSDRAIAKAIVRHALGIPGQRNEASDAVNLEEESGIKIKTRNQTDDHMGNNETGSRRLVILSGTDHESRMTAREVFGELSRQGRVPDFQFDIQPGAQPWSQQIKALEEAKPSTIILITSTEVAAAIVPEIRQGLPDTTVIGSHMLSRSSFLKRAGPAAEGIHCPMLFEAWPLTRSPGTLSPSVGQWDGLLPGARQFIDRFTAAFHVLPDYTAAFTYDAVRLLLSAASRSGGSRSQTLGNLRLSSNSGISGEVRFDGTGQNTRTNIPMGVIRNGVVVPLSDTCSTASRSR